MEESINKVTPIKSAMNLHLIVIILYGLFLSFYLIMSSFSKDGILISILVVFGTLLGLHLLARRLLSKGRGKLLSFLLATLLLFGFPIGTIIGIGLIYYLIQSYPDVNSESEQN